MLALFKPWHTGHNLKEQTESWDGAFNKCCFTIQSKKLMCNINIHYECLDAQNDFHAQMKMFHPWALDETTLKDLDQMIMDDCMDDIRAT